jgi:hypothetical protein
MSSSKLLEQAIVDAQALRDSAFKSAQATLLEKFAPQVKEAVEKLLEQEGDEEPGMQGSPEDALAAQIPPGTDFGGAPKDTSDKNYVSGKAKDIPRAAMDGEKLCPCPDDNEEVTLELNLADLADQLRMGMEAEEDEEDINMQPMLGGMQNQPAAAGGTGLSESLELDEELQEEAEGELEENIEVNLDEVLSESEHEDDEEEVQEGKGKPKWDRHDYGNRGNPAAATAAREKAASLKASLDKKKADLNKDGKLSSYEEKRGQAIQKSMEKQKTNESTVKQLMSTSAQLLKEHQNTVNLVEKKDSQIKKLLEENKKFSSTLEEMSSAFKKLDQVNLLNATLFYQNQVLKSASLNERQKTHIVEAISKADSVNEAKTVYQTLINSVGGHAKEERSPKSLNEAINKNSSFRLPHKQAEQPNDPNKDRWLKLAGIK